MATDLIYSSGGPGAKRLALWDYLLLGDGGQDINSVAKSLMTVQATYLRIGNLIDGRQLVAKSD